MAESPIEQQQTYDRARLVEVLIYHQRQSHGVYVGGCACGWGTRREHLGRSWAEHVADVFEDRPDG